MLTVDTRMYGLVWIKDVNENYGMMRMSRELGRNDI